MDVVNIKDPTFLKTMSLKDLQTLSCDIRQFLIENIAKTGGHLSSNLGVVELTIALHKIFESPTDHIIFDVGHQSYTHKILTGRAKDFPTLRQTDGLSGFLKRSESIHDVFEAGHTSTSLAAGAGMLYAKKHNDSIGHVVMVIGDGALTSGMALETLNFLGHNSEMHPIIIVNDNEMSISKNIGHLSKTLTKLRMKKSLRSIRNSTKKLVPKRFKNATLKVEKRLKGFIAGHSYFEDLGYTYFGPIDGHNYKSLLRALSIAKAEHKPCVIHVRTTKGKGYSHSENDTLGKWHGVKPFEIESGEFNGKNKPTYSYSKAVADYLAYRAQSHKNFYVITPAMIGGSELGSFQQAYPTQLIDVGIAEQTALTLACGMAIKNTSVFVSIYATFLQRAYDQLIHDVARHNAHVVIGVDRAGIVGGDGETHQGIYDIPMTTHIPNIKIAHPKDIDELYGLLNYAFNYQEGPMIVRYEKLNIKAPETTQYEVEPIKPSWSILDRGRDITIISFGDLVNDLHKTFKDSSINATVINARYIKPLDFNILNDIDLTKPLFIIEESTLTGGLGSMISDYYLSIHKNPNITRFGFNDDFVPQGNRQTMLKRYKLDSESILQRAKELLQCD